MHRILRIVGVTIAVGLAGNATTCEAGLFDWLWGPQPAQYAPTGVGYYPSGAYYGAGPAATHYTTNYAPNSYTTNYAPNYATGSYVTGYRMPASVPVRSWPYSYAPSSYAPSSYTTNYRGALAPSYSTYRAPQNGFYSAPTTTFYRAPRTTYYRAPTTSYYQPAQNSTYYRAPLRTTNYRGPLGLFNWQNACGGLTPCRPYASTTANYRPRTSFRPVWQRVPVTYFRPVSQVDPVTGQTVQQMQPCTTYRWQIQQRPSLLPNLRRRPLAAPAGEVWCDPVTGAPGGVIREGQGGATGAGADPYYNRSRIIRPGEGGLIPRDAEILREETLDPDERRPRLRETPPSPEGLGEVRRGGFGNVASSPTMSTRTPLAGTKTTNSRSLNRLETPQERQQSVMPERSSLIPDPDADVQGYPQPPKLIRPRDRTAEVPKPRFQSVAYEAVWPSSAKPVVRRVQRAQAVQPSEIREFAKPADKPANKRPPTRRLDDSGWRSLR